MNIDIKDSIVKCQKFIYRYSDGTKLRFDLIEDPEERDKALLLADYLWFLKKMNENAHMNIRFEIIKEEN